MLTRNHAQEGLSRAYVQAVAAAARVNLRMEGEFDYGFDGQFDTISIRDAINGQGLTVSRRVNSGFPIDFQLKCTFNWEAENDNISWSIPTKTYNDLVSRKQSAVAAILILMCIPENESDWVNVSEEFVTLRKCCYFTSLSGNPAPTEPSTKKILIPRVNVLNAENLKIALAAERKRREDMFN